MYELLLGLFANQLIFTLIWCFVLLLGFLGVLYLRQPLHLILYIFELIIYFGVGWLSLWDFSTAALPFALVIVINLVVIYMLVTMKFSKYIQRRQLDKLQYNYIKVLHNGNEQ